MAARRKYTPTRRLLRNSVRVASTADRVAHLLLMLTAAGPRGILVPDLLQRSLGSKSSLYRDIRRLRRIGWDILVTQELEGGPACYALASWQRVPKTK